MSVLKSSSFKKVLQYAKPFKSKLVSVAFWAIFLAIVAALRPLVLNITIDKYFVDASKETNVIQDYFLNLMHFILQDGNNAYNIKVLVVNAFYLDFRGRGAIFLCIYFKLVRTRYR